MTVWSSCAGLVPLQDVSGEACHCLLCLRVQGEGHPRQSATMLEVLRFPVQDHEKYITLVYKLPSVWWFLDSNLN